MYKLYDSNEEPQTPEDWCKYADECVKAIDKYEGKYAVLAARVAGAGFEAQCQNAGYTNEKMSEIFKQCIGR
jgi:hypothetical protein